MKSEKKTSFHFFTNHKREGGNVPTIKENQKSNKLDILLLSFWINGLYFTLFSNIFYWQLVIVIIYYSVNNYFKLSTFQMFTCHTWLQIQVMSLSTYLPGWDQCIFVWGIKLSTLCTYSFKIKFWLKEKYQILNKLIS